ncbi:hypothetical protein Tsubulata_035354, partial [Turnera subulata]
MHGVSRKTSKPEAEATAEARELRALQSQFLPNHHNKNYTKEALDLSAKLLEKNPEYYTAWNYRKLALQHALDSQPDLLHTILHEELQVAKNALKRNPKAYGAWHHRKWVLSKGDDSFLDKELQDLDDIQRLKAKDQERNFHIWNHRRFVTAMMRRSDKDELDHTENMIGTNFSNYSAWHNRSVLLSNLMEKKVQGFSQKNQVLTKELEFVRAALFTDEEDQSGWFYHLWLLDQIVKTVSPQLVSSWPSHGEVIQLRGSAMDGFFTSTSDKSKFDSVVLPI